MFSPRNYIYFLTSGFLCGVLSRGHFRFLSSWSIMFLLLLATGVASFSFWFRYKSGRDYSRVLVSLLVVIIAFVCGWLRAHSYDTSTSHLPLDAYLDQKVTLVGRVVEVRDSAILLEVDTVISGDNTQHISTETILVNKINGSFAYRDIVALSATVAKPQNFNLKDGSLFDNVSYLKRQGVYHVVSFPTLLEQKKRDDITLRSVLAYIKESFAGRVSAVIPEPESSLALGTTIAGKGVLPEDVKEDFIRAGLIHIVVLSGYNIALVVRFFVNVFYFASRRVRVFCAFGGVIVFVLMVGPSAPVVRSAIMACITLLGTLSYTKVSQNKVLAGAVLVMTLWNPLIIPNDASFILSVIATFAIINYADIVSARLGFVTERIGLRQMLAETLGTQIFVLPYLLYEIGNLSLVAPLSNIIILPIIPLLMLLTFCVAIVSSIPIIYIPFSVLLILVSTSVIRITHLFARIPFGYFQIDRLPLWVMIIMYTILLGSLVYLRGVLASREERSKI